VDGAREHEQAERESRPVQQAVVVGVGRSRHEALERAHSDAHAYLAEDREEHRRGHRGEHPGRSAALQQGLDFEERRPAHQG
jgi:hypothetical protein